MRVAYRPAVAGDLRDIFEHIAKDNRTRAAAFVTKLVARCEKIGSNPKGGRLRPEIAEGVRSRAFRSYVILYRIDVDCMRVLRVVHGARDLERLPM